MVVLEGALPFWSGLGSVLLPVLLISREDGQVPATVTGTRWRRRWGVWTWVSRIFGEVDLNEHFECQCNMLEKRGRVL